MKNSIYKLCNLRNKINSRVLGKGLAISATLFASYAMAVDGEIPIEIITTDIEKPAVKDAEKQNNKSPDGEVSRNSSTEIVDDADKNVNIDANSSQDDSENQSKGIDPQTREKMRNTYIENCKNRSSQKEPNAKVHLVACSISKNEIFQIYYELMVEPDETYERGKNIPLYRHYPKMKSTLCETVEDLNDAGFTAVRILYQYNGSVIQSNYLDLNDCYL